MQPSIQSQYLTLQLKKQPERDTKVFQFCLTLFGFLIIKKFEQDYLEKKS